MQVTIAEDRDGISLANDAHAIRKLGFLILKMNRVIHQAYLDLASTIVDRKERESLILGDVFGTFFLQRSEAFGPAFARYWAMYKEGMKAAESKGQTFDFESAFQNAFATRYEIALAVGFAVWTYFSRLPNEPLGRTFSLNPAEYLKTIVNAEVRTEFTRILQYFSWDWKTHVARLNEWRDKELARGIGQPLLSAYTPTLYSRPMVTVGGGAGYFMLDVEYFTSKLTEGVYWAVFDSLPTSQEKRNLNAAFGVSAEWYAARILKATFGKDKPRAVWLDWDNEFEADAGCTPPDAVVVEGNTAFVFEVTTVATAPSTSTSGNWNQIVSSLRELWFGGEGKKAKLSQLCNASESIQRKKVRAQDLDPGTIATVYPVLVGLRTLPQTAQLSQRYRELMVEEGLPGWFVDRIVFLDFAEMEWLASLHVLGTSWVRVFDEMRSAQPKPESVQNYLSRSRHEWEWHPEVETLLFDAFDAQSQLLFGHPIDREKLRSSRRDRE